MKPLRIVILMFFFLSKNNYAQDFDRCWPLGIAPFTQGVQSNLVFTSSGIRIDTAFREVIFGLTEASISDSQGNLKLFTNGCVVMNTLNDTMLNGDSINRSACQNSVCSTGGGGVTQGTLILPAPGQSNLFYIFHEPCGPGGNPSPVNLYYSLVDLTLDSGKGAVTNINTSLHVGTLCDGSLSAVKHANGIDWWVVVHEKYTDRFIRYLLTNFGISGPFFQNIGITYFSDGHGNSKFSPDGSMYAASTQLGGVDLFDFDRCTGQMSNYRYVDLPDSLFINTLEFSPDSRLLYAASYVVINQFDLNASNIQSSGQQVAIYDGFLATTTVPTYFLMQQLGPDGKIYVSCAPGSAYLHVIEQPNVLGSGCNVLQHSISLYTRNKVLPNLVNYRLGALDSLNCDTTNSIADMSFANDRISVFPNPTSDFIAISTLDEKEKIENVLIYDQVGRLVISEKNKFLEIDFRSICSGIFFTLVETNKGRYFRKIVVSE